MIVFDYTILFQIIVFLSLWFVLNKLLFRPFLALIEERERRTEGVKSEAASLTNEGARLRAEYQEKIEQARDEGYRVKESLLQEARHERERILSRAREEAATMLEKAKEEIRREMQKERDLSAREAENIAQEMAQKVLGRRVG